jgi:maltose alpha-D-glucosyltransferase/alpha-amylase
MLKAMADGTSIATPEGRIVFEGEPGKSETLRRPPDATVMWLSAEQSNSSLVVDDAVMLKIFRRVSTGHHPEAEMSRYLTRQGFANAPPLLGEVIRIDDQGQRHSLAVAQSFLRNQGDAWAWTLSQFTRALDNLATDEATSEARADDVEDYNTLAATIGRQLAIMHTVLAHPTDDEAFRPRIAAEADIAQWKERAYGLLDQAFDIIAGRASWENEADGNAASALLANRAGLRDALDHMADQGMGSVVCRIHGDFHLGQILVASGDAFIIDFEGEPARPLEERRAKASPLRDVAGLLRSIDYAIANTRDPKKLLAAPPLPDEVRSRFASRLRDGAQRAFLEAYRAGVGDLPGLAGSDLMEFFMVEKAAYELIYESANRPVWLSIPLQGLYRLMNRILSGKTLAETMRTDT